MAEFQFFFEQGFSHITGLDGFDHILFLVVLSIAYEIRDWKKLLFLITAFTIGHTATLLLSLTNFSLLPSSLIEFLIPTTILLTAIGNVIFFKENHLMRIRYPLALLFGLIHGLGFSNSIRSLFDKNTAILKPLLAFNLGLELGQVIIVAIITMISLGFVSGLRIQHKFWRIGISIIAAGFALKMMLARI